MPKKNEKYYRILDLEPGASKEEVKKAYRELSQIWHPDMHMGKSSNVQNRTNEKFKKISNAYQVLNDYLNKGDSSSKKDDYENESASRAEERRKEKQKRKDSEQQEKKQREENKRRQQEEENRRKAEQGRKDGEEKEKKHWEEQARKKHAEEKNKQNKKESWVSLVSVILAFLVSGILIASFLFSMIKMSSLNSDSRSERASRQKPEVKIEREHNQNNETSEKNEPNQEHKFSEGILIEDISIAELLKTGEKQKCGSHTLQLKEKKEEESDTKYEYIEIMNDRGEFYDSVGGYRISAVACYDLTGDGKLNLFLQYWGGGNSPSSFDSYVYILEDPTRLILNLFFHHVSDFIDLNNDGIHEITSYYSFRYIGGLCGTCSPPMIPQYFCYQNGRYKDCSNQFPDFYASLLSNAKGVILNELEKIPNIQSISDDSELDQLKAYSVLALVSAILLDREDQESEYLRKTLPESVFTWLNEKDNKDYIASQLNIE